MIRGAENIEMKVMPKKNTIFEANEANRYTSLSVIHFEEKTSFIVSADQCGRQICYSEFKQCQQCQFRIKRIEIATLCLRAERLNFKLSSYHKILMPSIFSLKTVIGKHFH